MPQIPEICTKVQKAIRFIPALFPIHFQVHSSSSKPYNNTWTAYSVVCTGLSIDPTVSRFYELDSGEALQGEAQNVVKKAIGHLNNPIAKAEVSFLSSFVMGQFADRILAGIEGY